jgi:2,3-bisphosphoglycerate-independent phosphoglycerate mutase
MKYLVIVPDGCSDWPIPSLEGKTPLEAADIRYMNELAKTSEVGMVRTIPEGIEPGSDAANLSLMGFDPDVYLTGRASLEAAGMGMELSPGDVAFRVNLITLEGNGQYEDLLIKDHSAGDISSEEAAILINYIDKELGDTNLRFYPGISYRNLLVTDKLPAQCELTPPHDALNQLVGRNMPKGEGAEQIGQLMRRSYELLKDHPLNNDRAKKGLNTANSIWFWGQGTKPNLPLFGDKYGISGSVITAVSLIKGIGFCAGLSFVDVPGATGTLNTNYDGKALGAIGEFEQGKDFVYLHVEAPDECSHNGDLPGKIKALELIDEKIVKPLADYLESTGDPYRILIISDHRTPLATRTHSSEPVPFILFDSEKKLPSESWKTFSETSGEQGLFFARGCDLADYYFQLNK